MRRMVLGGLALASLAAGPAMAQRQCGPSDRAAFELQALRSELMVLATGCQQSDKYNAFIRKYQPELQANETELSSYFKRHYGRASQTEHDRFVTEMANAKSRQGTSMGSEFCPRNGLIFNEVLALRGGRDLPDYVAGKDLIPGTISVCDATAAPAAPAPAPAKKATITTARK